MSLQLGLIVLPSTNEELQQVLAALTPLGSGVSVTQVAASKTTKKADEPAPKTEKLKPVTPDQLKAVMTKVRDELGEDTLAELLTAFGATKLKEVDKEDWPALVAAGEAALNEGNDDPEDDGFGLDDPEDDGFDELDEGDAPDAEEVKTACQAHAKKHGKEKTQAILSKHGLNTVRGLASADAATLTKIMNAVK